MIQFSKYNSKNSKKRTRSGHLIKKKRNWHVNQNFKTPFHIICLYIIANNTIRIWKNSKTFLFSFPTRKGTRLHIKKKEEPGAPIKKKNSKNSPLSIVRLQSSDNTIRKISSQRTRAGVLIKRRNGKEVDKVDGRRHQGFRRVAARVNHVPKVDGRARDDWERQWVKKWGPRAKQGHPRKKKKFFRPLPGETPTRSSSLFLEAIRGSPLLPSRVPSIFPATRTGTNCDSTVATSSSSPPSPPLLLLRGKVLLRTLIVAQFSKKIARLPRTAKKKLEQSLSVMAKRF